MASNTAETEFKRARRHTNAGKDRKRDLANKGTTKPFWRSQKAPMPAFTRSMQKINSLDKSETSLEFVPVCVTFVLHFALSNHESPTRTESLRSRLARKTQAHAQY